MSRSLDTIRKQLEDYWKKVTFEREEVRGGNW